MEGDSTRAARERMVREQLAARGIKDGRLLAMMRVVPRHRFVEAGLEARAYEDGPLPIGFDATISQPYVVAAMTELLRLRGTEKVLEIGTGSGYGAAVLAELAKDVFTIEILDPLAVEAGKTLDRLGYKNVHVRSGDGYRGWPEESPFDAILVTAAPDEVPEPLLEQLKPGGRLVIPLGTGSQELIRLTRTDHGFDRESLLPVRFVPMTGEARQPRH